MTCEDAGLNKEVPGSVRKGVYILSISNFFSDLGSGMLITLVPLYIIGLKSSFLDMPLMMKAGLAASIFGLAMVAFQPITGRLLDRLGRRKPFILAGFIMYFLMSLLYARSSSFEGLLVIRFLHGMAVAVI
ncbi:MAG: MFS transporter, partial [Candidatus Methanoperedens sp.]|nr:MFS transporter [Candidatus Methanoperedens sp.]